MPYVRTPEEPSSKSPPRGPRSKKRQKDETGKSQLRKAVRSAAACHATSASPAHTASNQTPALTRLQLAAPFVLPPSRLASPCQASTDALVDTLPSRAAAPRGRMEPPPRWQLECLRSRRAGEELDQLAERLAALPGAPCSVAYRAAIRAAAVERLGRDGCVGERPHGLRQARWSVVRALNARLLLRLCLPRAALRRSSRHEAAAVHLHERERPTTPLPAMALLIRIARWAAVQHHRPPSAAPVGSLAFARLLTPLARAHPSPQLPPTASRPSAACSPPSAC